MQALSIAFEESAILKTMRYQSHCRTISNPSRSESRRSTTRIWKRPAATSPAAIPAPRWLWFVPSLRQRHNSFYKLDATGGWGALCEGGVRSITLYATHLTMLDVDHAHSAAEWLKKFLR